jgi:hypothetical protein
MSRTIKRIDLETINDFYDQTQEQIREMRNRIKKAKEEAVKEAQIESEKRIKEAQKELERKMAQKSDAIRADVRKQLDQMEANHQKQMNEIIKRVDTRIGSVEKDVKSIFDVMEKTKEAAGSAIEMARARLADLELRIDLNRFASEKAEEVRRHVEALTAFPTAESKITAAYHAIQETFDLETAALKEKLKHDSMVEFSRQQLDAVLKLTNQNREVETNDAEGNPVRLDSDYWSQGHYGELKEELITLQNELQADELSLDKQRIDQINERIAEIEKEISKLSSECIRLAVLSEHRVDVAKDIVKCLVSQGWTIKKDNGLASVGYMGGEEAEDMRQGFYAIMEDKSLGQEITILVNPSDQTNTNQLIIQRNDLSPRSSAEYMRQLNSILRQIEKSGYKAGCPQEPSNGGDERIPEIMSAEQLRKKGAAETLRKRL